MANSDIWFDDSLRLLNGISSDRSFVALTRWDSPSHPDMEGHLVHIKVGEEGSLERLFFSGTQDSWCFVAGDVHLSVPEVRIGQQSCDQAIVAWACGMKLYVTDPAISIRSWHEHGKKNEVQPDFLAGMYAYPELTTTDTTGRIAFHNWPEDVGPLGLNEIIRVTQCLR